jgi:hypothetical protein
MWWVIVGGVTCLSSRHFFGVRGLFQFENKEIGQLLKIDKITRRENKCAGGVR